MAINAKLIGHMGTLNFKLIWWNDRVKISRSDKQTNEFVALSVFNKVLILQFRLGPNFLDSIELTRKSQRAVNAWTSHECSEF